MKILFVTDSQYCWQSGIWFHRNHIPSIGLKKRGHGVEFVSLGAGEISDHFLKDFDTVVFGRTYHPDMKPLDAMRKFKAAGNRIIYDIDDDFWAVREDNPSKLVSNAYKDQYESFIRECDAITTPSKVLEKKIKKLAKDKPVFICNNSVSYEYYLDRPKQQERLTIGYSGAASHWEDLGLIIEPITELKKKYDFNFVIQGMVGAPIEAEMYVYDQIVRRNLQPEREEYHKNAIAWFEKMKAINMYHIPFFPPELHPRTLALADMDIGLAPLMDDEFNHGKSCLKYYEYASVGTAVLSSDVKPYSDEVSYRAKNTVKDWYDKLEKLITDKDFREKVTKEQGEWVKKNRDMDVVAIEFEKAYQLPGGLEVSEQK